MCLRLDSALRQCVSWSGKFLEETSTATGIFINFTLISKLQIDFDRLSLKNIFLDMGRAGYVQKLSIN